MVVKRKGINWKVYFIGLAIGLVAWIFTGSLMIGVVVSIAARIFVGAVWKNNSSGSETD